jgi:ParB/Sulfiredoxin domain
MTQVDEELIKLPIAAIVPYWRNPRNATDRDIAKIMRSIEEYGYQSPIIVDANHVIIAGHTRYLALRRLGWSEIPVLVRDLPEHLAKEYRIIDNRAGEFTEWDHTRLMAELREFTSPSMVGVFFPEIDLTFAGSEPVFEEPEYRDVGDEIRPSRICTCPHCYVQFSLEEATAS